MRLLLSVISAMFSDGLTVHAILGMQCFNNYINTDHELLMYIKTV